MTQFLKCKLTDLFRLFCVATISVTAILSGACLETQEQNSSQIVFEIRSGERVQDWCARFPGASAEDSSADGASAESGIEDDWLDCALIESVAAQLSLPQAQFPELIQVLPPARAALNRFEGMFVPGSYAIELPAEIAIQSPQVRARYLIMQLLERTERRLAEKRVNESSSSSSGLDAYEQMILASIVEKEAVSNRDYDKVASVFLNRLRKNQPLGSCPTVEYALGFHRPFLLFKDLELDSPYNVYVRKGLPPTPIAFFSDGALAAALQPAQTDYFFFVYDWTTRNLVFTAEYADHKRNAQTARENFIQHYGRDVMYKAFPDKFYEDI